MRLHHGHHTAPTSRRIGRPNSCARWKASAPHGYQFTGWPTARLRYGERSPLRRSGFACATAQATQPRFTTSIRSILDRICHKIQRGEQSFNRDRRVDNGFAAHYVSRRCFQGATSIPWTTAVKNSSPAPTIIYSFKIAVSSGRGFETSDAAEE